MSDLKSPLPAIIDELRERRAAILRDHGLGG